MEKKRIGILSYSAYGMKNYGGILQAFALREAIEKMSPDIEAENIRFLPRPAYSRSKLRALISSVYQRVVVPLIKNREREKRTRDFYDSFMFRGNYASDELSVVEYVNANFDKLIIGSDQVLNPFINSYSEIYLGKGINLKTYFYAASFGVGIIDERWKSRLIANLGNVQKKSFREETGVRIVENLGFEGRVDLDPTLLISKEEWLRHCKAVHLKLPEKYIFCYIMPGNKQVVRLIKKVAKKIAKEKGMKIIYCGQKDYMRFVEPFRDKGDYGPLEWLYALSRSSIVLTNSFHGTAFSVNFSKPFLAFTNSGRSSSTNNFSSRIVDFLSMLNLSKLVDSPEKCEEAFEIDYSQVNEILTSLRADSLGYLKEVLDD